MDPTTWPTFHVSSLEPTRSTRPARDLTATRYTFFALTPVLFRYTWYTYYTYILRISTRADSRLSHAGVLGTARRRRRTCKRRRTILSTRNRAISKAKSVWKLFLFAENSRSLMQSRESLRGHTFANDEALVRSRPCEISETLVKY